MTPLERAVRATLHPAAEPSRVELAKAASLIRAFLEAAAEDDRVAENIGVAVADCGSSSYFEEGRAAILALKETLNG